MDFLKSLFEPGTVVGIIGVLIGVWGLWVGYKGKRIQLLEHQVSSTQIITNRTNNIPGLKIVVGDEFVSDLISSKIEFFNHGNTTIMQKDFASTAPLQIITSGHFFNIGTINKESIESDNLNLNPELNIPDNKTLAISFEYLKPKQSFSMTVLHDGEITIVGDLKAGKIRPQQNTSDAKLTDEKGLSGEFRSVLIDTIIGAIIGGVFASLLWFSVSNLELDWSASQLSQQIEDLAQKNSDLEDELLILHEALRELKMDENIYLMKKD